MPNKIRPIRNFESTLDKKEEILFAKRLIIATLNVFTDARGNHYLDIMAKPTRYAKFLQTERPIRKTKTSAEDNFHLSRLNGTDRLYIGALFNDVINSYHFKIGNCAFMAKVALYLASKHGKNVLQSAVVINIWAADHVILKLVFKNGTELFVDPWFKNQEFEGAIFTAESAKQYYKVVTDILSKSLLIQAPVAGLLGFIFVIYKPEQQKNLDFVTPLQVTIALMIAIHLYYLTHKNFLNPRFIETLIAHNQDASTMRLKNLFDLFLLTSIQKALTANSMSASVMIDIIRKYSDSFDKCTNASTVTPVTFGLIENVCDKNLLFSNRHKRSQSLPNLLEQHQEHKTNHEPYSLKRRMSF